MQVFGGSYIVYCVIFACTPTQKTPQKNKQQQPWNLNDNDSITPPSKGKKANSSR